MVDVMACKHIPRARHDMQLHGAVENQAGGCVMGSRAEGSAEAGRLSHTDLARHEAKGE